MLNNMNEKRQAKRLENMQKRIDRMEAAYEALKEEKAEIEMELVVCKAKLDRTGEYEKQLKETLAQAREAKRSYDAARKDLEIMRRRYAEEVNVLIAEIKGR